MTDELRNFVREAVGHAFEGAPPPGTPSDTANYGGGDEGLGWRPEAEDADRAGHDGQDLAEEEEDVDESEDGAPVWASEDDEEAAAAGAQVMESLSPEDAEAVLAGDLELWERRVREMFPNWDDEAEDGDDEDAALALGKPMQPAIPFVEALLADESDLVYPDGSPVDTTELMRWMVSAPAGEFDEWAAQVGWEGPQPSIQDLPADLTMQLTADKLADRLQAIELAKERGERPPYIE